MEEKIVPSTPVTDVGKEFKAVREKFNSMIDDITKAAPSAVTALRAVRCGGGCHQGVIE